MTMMDLLANKMFTFPQHLAVQCSDKILMHINRPTNFQQTIDLSFEDFSEGHHTDVTLATDDGVKFKVHGFILSAASPFLRNVLGSTFSPNLEYTLLLPDTNSTVVSCLAQLLYGCTVITCRDTLVQLTRLVDVLGIQLCLISDIPADTTLEEHQHQTTLKDQVPAPILPVAEETIANNVGEDDPETIGVETVADNELPLCCYHCCQPFSSFESLSSHICTKAVSGKRHHRCNQCGTVLSSMWRLRQHLAEHARNRSQGAVQGAISGGKGDHVYGRSSRRVQTKVQTRGDHGYAGTKKTRPRSKS